MPDLLLGRPTDQSKVYTDAAENQGLFVIGAIG